MDSNYIQKQLTLYYGTTNQAAKSDALWRIASNADIFSAEELNKVDNHNLPVGMIEDILNWLFARKFYF